MIEGLEERVDAALAAAVAYAAYVLMAEGALRRGRDQYSLLAWGFTFSALFWAVVQPWWSFAWDEVTGSASLLGRIDAVSLPVPLLLGYVVILGTVVPFIFLFTALPYVPATRVTILAMLEPVLAAVIAYAWLGEELTGTQIAGAILVLVGVLAKGQPPRTPSVVETPPAEIALGPATSGPTVVLDDQLALKLVALAKVPVAASTPNEKPMALPAMVALSEFPEN